MAPLTNAPRGGEVYVKTENGGKSTYESLFKFDAADHLVWAFQAAVWRPAKKTLDGQDNGKEEAERAEATDPRDAAGLKDKPSTADNKLLFRVTRSFLTRLAEAIASAPNLDETRRQALATMCGSLDFLVALL